MTNPTNLIIWHNYQPSLTHL